MFQVNGAFGSGCLQTVREILDAHRNGILRVCNASGGSGVLGVIPAFGGLHGVIAPAAGFLHHHGLNQRNIIRDAIGMILGSPQDVVQRHDHFAVSELDWRGDGYWFPSTLPDIHEFGAVDGVSIP